MSDSGDTKSAGGRPKSIPAPPAVPRPASPSRPPPTSSTPQQGVVPHRPTTRMTADEIAAVMNENDRARSAGGEFDPEKTMVLDPDEDGVDESADEAPTRDYDPRSRGVHLVPNQPDTMRAGSPASRAETSVAPVAMPPEPPPAGLAGPPSSGEPARTTERRRTSRRTVKIPDDPVQRKFVGASVEAAVVDVMRRTSQPAPAPTSDAVPSAISSEIAPTARAPEPPPEKHAPDRDDPLAKTTEVRSAAAIESPITQVSDTDDAAATGEHPIVDEITIVRPLRIISIGSDPPPPITSAVEEWPPTKPYVAPEPPVSAAAAETVRTNVPSEKKTDLLPPPVIPEDGWTPVPPEVAATAGGLAQPGLPRFDEPVPSTQPKPAEAEDASIDASELADSDEHDLLEEIEPDAAPIPAKKPPPPPKGEARSRAAEAPPAETGAKKPKPWFEEVFGEDYIKTMDVLPLEHVKKEVDFIEESLGVEHDGVILDLACGRGEHAIELASRGYNVMGVDLSPIALATAHENLRKSKASAGGSPQRGKPSFLRTDMRELDFEENFDGAYCWSTSFGYFDDETNLLVLKRLHRALRQGGMLLIDVINRDFVAPRSPSLVWFEGDRCVCMDDMYVDFLTSRLRVKRTAMFEDGHSRELEYSIRLYSLDTLGRLLHEVGFRVVEVTGLIAHPGIFFGTESPRLIVLAERA